MGDGLFFSVGGGGLGLTWLLLFGFAVLAREEVGERMRMGAASAARRKLERRLGDTITD